MLKRWYVESLWNIRTLHKFEIELSLIDASWKLGKLKIREVENSGGWKSKDENHNLTKITMDTQQRGGGGKSKLLSCFVEEIFVGLET